MVSKLVIPITTAFDALVKTIDASFTSKMSPYAATALLATGGTGGLWFWIEKATSYLGLFAAFFTCVGAAAGAFYWIVKAYLIWKNRKSSKPPF